MKWFHIYLSNFITCLSVTNIIINAVLLLCKDRVKSHGKHWRGEEVSRASGPQDQISDLSYSENVRSETLGWKQDGLCSTVKWSWNLGHWEPDFSLIPTFIQQIHIEGLLGAKQWPWSSSHTPWTGWVCPHRAGRKEKQEAERWLFHLIEGGKAVQIPKFYSFFNISVSVC